MASKDLVSSVDVRSAILNQAIGDNDGATGTIIDTQGFESVFFSLQVGTVTAGDYTLDLEEGDAANLSDTGAVADGDLIGTEALASFSADTDDDKIGLLGYTGSKRYLRLNITSANVSTGVDAIGATCILGHARDTALLGTTDQTPED